MRRHFLIATLVALPVAVFLFMAVSHAGIGEVKIVKPEEGELVTGSSYMVEFELVTGPKGGHVHIFLDGKHLGPITKKSKYKLTNLKMGPHTVTLKLADRKHVYLGPQGEVSFTVK